ncbi:MAG: nucleotidyltransferase family protein [Gammaproteobacteria bacterium]|nr:MAG: nucleotidyltransferase family protein [Gammaproteobacteria bacterium]
MKAMILAAGRGERMRPLTDKCPKPLLKAGDKALIEYQIERLIECGIKEFVINHAWLGDMIEKTLGNGSKYGAKISYSHEEEALETGGGITKALPLLGEDPFWVISSDVWSFIHFDQVKIPENSHAHLLMVGNPEHHQQGDFHLNEEGWLEKQGDNRLTYSGVGIFSPKLFHDCKTEKFPLRDVIFHAIDDNRCSGEVYEGPWMDIGTPARLAIIEEQIENGIGFP